MSFYFNQHYFYLGAVKQWWGATSQRKNGNQLWKLEQVQGGHVEITNAETGDTLAQWKNAKNLNCGPLQFYCKNKLKFVNNFEECKVLNNRDNMWTLIPQN